MCGIAGVMRRRESAPPTNLRELAVMAGALGHRGPDEFGVCRDHVAGLAHARLSIIDLASGQQPLTNERDTLWVTLDGEIFNYVELRDGLGRARPSLPDAQRHGSDRARLRRMGRRRLPPVQRPVGHRSVGQRTPGARAGARSLGVRPLYVTEHDGRLMFASEVKALFAGDRPCRASSIRTGSMRPSRSGAGGAADGLRRHREIYAGHGAHLLGPRRHHEPFRQTQRSRWRRGRLHGSSTTRSTPCGRRCPTPAACGCCAPTCPSAATCREASTARSSPRLVCAPRAPTSARSHCASRTRNTTRPAISG